MAKKKISELTAFTAPALGDLLAAVDISDLTSGASGTTKKITLQNLIQNLPAMTIANQLSFSAAILALAGINPNSSGGQALTVYNYGTWTPTIIGSSTAGTQTYSRQAGYFVRIGPVVACFFRVTITAKDAAIAGSATLGGLPYAINAQGISAFTHNFPMGASTGVTVTSGRWLSLQSTTGGVSTALLQECDGNTIASISVANIAAATDLRGCFIYLA